MTVMIPPWVRPVSPQHWTLLDDGTTLFQPQFARGSSQTQIWADPRWQVKRTYQGMRLEEKASLMTALRECRGKAITILTTPGNVNRGVHGTGLPGSKELLLNAQFDDGINNWQQNNGAFFEAADRVMRIQSTGQTNNPGITQVVGASAFIANFPLAARAFMAPGLGSSLTPYVNAGDNSTVTAGAQTAAVGGGMLLAAFVPSVANITFAMGGLNASPPIGDYIFCLYSSLSPCMLVDNGPNLFLHSDTPGGTSWTATNVTVAMSGSVISPDGSLSSYAITETSATGVHTVAQAVTIAGVAGRDFAFSIDLKSGLRNWAWIRLTDSLSGTTVTQWFSISNNTVGTFVHSNPGVGFENNRSFKSVRGGGWFRCTLIAQCMNASSSITATCGLATADTVSSYAGSAASIGAHAYRASFAQSSVPVREVQTTTTNLPTGTPQNGSAIYVKGIYPPNVTGILEQDDWFDIGLELKKVSYRLNSNAQGLGYLQFRPSLAASPADSTPIITHEPFGRFACLSNAEYDDQWGVYTQGDLELTEIFTP